MLKRIKDTMNLKQLSENEEGLTTVEYVLLLALIAIVAIGAWTSLGSAVNKGAKKAATKINNAVTN